MKTGIVVKTTGSWHTVKVNGIRLQCRLKGAFRNQNMKNTNPVAVGDRVEIEDKADNTWIINRIEKRKNYIIRKSIKLSRETQIMASNIDQAMLMFTLDFPETPLEFVDRFLVAAEAYHIPVILLINKIDLYTGEKTERMHEVINMYQDAGYTVMPISVTQKTNMEQVSASVNGKITLVAGNSGTGKTSMINYLCPGLNLKTNDISWYHQAGKHTTTYPEMIEINDTTFLIDSPGIRGFGMTDLQKNEIGLYFTDIFRISRNCQFYNCSHIHEPGCAVIEAVERGILHESRYRSYFNIFTDTDEKYRTG